MVSTGDLMFKALKGLSFIALSAFAAYTWNYSTLSYMRSAEPEAAAKRKPTDATALSLSMISRLQKDPAYRPSDVDLDNARKGLIAKPLNPIFFVFRGIRFEADGKKDQADNAMTIAGRISRRESISQLWQIETASAAGNVVETVRHYHAALSVHPELEPTLLPVLSSGLSFPAIRVALMPYARMHARWMPAFLGIASTQAGASDLRAFVGPIATSLALPVYENVNMQILNRLAVAGDTRSVMELAPRLIPGFQAVALTSLAVSNANKNIPHGIFGWSLTENGDISSAIDGDGSLNVSIAPLARGDVASRDVIVAPGSRQELKQRIIFEDRDARAQLRWTADCVRAEGIEPIWEQILPDTSSEMTFRFIIDVPQRCNVVRLIMSARGPEGQAASNITVLDLNMKKI